jgi:hypothetical protein
MSQEIIIATIAAASAIAGSVISQILTVVLSCFDKKHQRKVLLREKYEEMALLYSESLQWFQNVGASSSYEELLQLSFPFHTKKMQVLCSIYFPKLVGPSAQYANACNSYFQSLTNGFNPSLNISAIIQAQPREAHRELMKKITLDRQAFDNALMLYAKEYAKA